jgi:hypothetical protein
LFLGADDPWVEADATFATAEPGGAAGPGNAGEDDRHSGVATGDDGLRHCVYSELLDCLELRASHFEDLRRRGLPASEITRRGYKTIDAVRVRQAVDGLLSRRDVDALLTVPGFQQQGERVLLRARVGYLVPVRDHAGRLNALKVRHDATFNGPKYSWVSSRQCSCGSPVHVPLGVEPPVATVRLTEGEIKADVATVLSGLPTVSAPGVTSWPLAIPVLKELGAHSVRLAFDQDGKPGTLAAIQKALYGLTREGFEVLLEWWHGRSAKGIDDALALGQPVETISGVPAAVRVMDVISLPGRDNEDRPEPDPDPFPVEVLPPALAAYCREVAEATSTPPDFAGLTMLATAGAAIGNSRALCLKEYVWHESPRIYGANVGDPASGKTPPADAVLKPYQALQLRLLSEYRRAKAEYDQAMAEHEAVLRENRGLPPAERRPPPDAPEVPGKPEPFVVMEATVESLAPLLEENPRGLLMPQDEGVGWVRGMGQYKGGRGNDRQFWLSNWSGKSHMVDRKSQGVLPVSIPRPFVNVVCGIPPDMLGELADYQGRNDGFSHRVLFVYPRAAAGTDWTEATVTDGARQAWESTLVGLRALAMREMDDGAPGYEVVRFSPTAKEPWVEWWDAHAAEIRSAELPVQMVGPWGKLKAYAARLALVLHYLWLVQTDGDEGDLQAASVERAIRLINYFKTHLRRVYSRLRQTPEDNHIQEVLDWTRRRGGQCTPRDLANAKKVTPTDRAKKLLKESEERGYGRIEWRHASNGKKVQWFVFDPT